MNPLANQQRPHRPTPTAITLILILTTALLALLITTQIIINGAPPALATGHYHIKETGITTPNVFCPTGQYAIIRHPNGDTARYCGFYGRAGTRLDARSVVITPPTPGW